VNHEDVKIIIVTGKSGAGKQPRIEVLLHEFMLTQLSTGKIFREHLALLKDTNIDLPREAYWNEKKHAFLKDEKIKQAILAANASVCVDIEKLVLAIKEKYFLDSGLFVPDDITNNLFAYSFGAYNFEGVVLDGYPRTKLQAQFLLDLLNKHGKKVAFVFLVESDDASIISRISGRRICPSCGAVYHIQYKQPVDGKYCSNCGTEVVQRTDDNEENIRIRLQEFEKKTAPALKYLNSRKIPFVKVSGNLPVLTDEAINESVMSAIAPLFNSNKSEK
jgi:adenylate kinase